MPWFMTVFGRDTLITSLQTLLFGPELAAGALRALAALQATEDDAASSTPSPARSSTSSAAEGRDDLVPGLLRLDRRDAALPRPAVRALALDGRRRHRAGAEGPARSRRSNGSSGTATGTATGSSSTQRRTPDGLENQSWKDSGDSQRFADGRLAEPPIAPVEVQGYAYDARRRTAELARAVWGEPSWRTGSRPAPTCSRRFDEAFWVEERADVRARPRRRRSSGSTRSARTSAICSGRGSSPSRRVAIAAALAGDGLWSGWGIRTMGVAEAAYNPLSYHNGTVWPHDSALAAWGLARPGTGSESALSREPDRGASSFDYSLPEVFAGFARDETAFPIAYPTAARPQAWAAGAPVLCLTLLLGLRPDSASRRLVSDAPTPPPGWLAGTRLDGVRAFGKWWTVEVGTSRVAIERMSPN